MIHELSVKYDDESKKLQLYLDGSPEELANALEDFGPDGNVFLTIMSAIVKAAAKRKLSPDA